jgi:protein-ribulosamine 3-kinase
MTVPPPVADWCRARGFGEILAVEPHGGGCIHASYRLRTSDGGTLFLKINSAVPVDMFPREAEGLAALAVGGGPRIPRPHLWGATFLLLEDLPPAAPKSDSWERLGQQLASLHGHTSDQYGFEADNYIGLTPQPNPWTENGHVFFAQHRLRFQARRALEAGLLARHDAAAVETLADRLEELIPPQPASLIHGDLWSGNVIVGPEGEACLIDPACHYGWAEAELGMTQLFGGFPERFYRAYVESFRLSPGWEDRLPIYNLYHLLNHLNLFGSGYLGSVQSILRKFT